MSFILNGSQSGSAALFDSIINFLSGLYALVGTPLDCDATLFATRSRFSAFGIHRDPVSNFLFLAEGEKTFYLWPRNAVPGEPEVVPGAEIPALWESAEKIHLRAGDMLYMPTGYYHCGLQDGFSVHISIVVPTVDQRVTQTFLWRELEPFLRNCFDGSAGKSFVMKPKEMLLTKVPESITLPLRQGLDRARAAEQTIREALLRTQSASGFPAVPPERPYAPLKSSDWIVARRSNLHVMPVGAEFLVAACGQMYRCPAHPLLLQLLETLMTGEPVQVRQLLRRFTGPAQIEGQEVSLDAQWIRLFLRSLGQASWLKLVPSKGRAHGRSRTRVRSSRP